MWFSDEAEPGQNDNTIQEDKIRQFLHLVIDIQEVNQPHRKQKLCFELFI